MTLVGTIDLSQFNCHNYDQSKAWLRQQLKSLRKDYYTPDERIVILHNQDFYVQGNGTGTILKNLQVLLNEEDISNCFVQLHTTNTDIVAELDELQQLSTDINPIEYILLPGTYTRSSLDRLPYSREEQYQYGSANPIKVSLDNLSSKHRSLLSESKTFCMYPWIHLHAWPTGQAFPCCHAESPAGQLGNTRTQTLETIWNSPKQCGLRKDMLEGTPNSACVRCYEQEQSGFFSGRQSANKHHGHHITRVDATQSTGYLDQFQMTYWDIRFSNLCNLKCRSCGHIFSSQWYQDQAKLAGGNWKERNTVLNYAGRTETDMWEQLEPHLDYVEQIYFAGGEPLLMEEHYRILDELVRRKRFDVRLIYNTNFTHTDLKGRSVFEYWKQFESVAVGASLDAMGTRGEYIRKGTDWAVVEQNRRRMLEICPQVDFYISPTLSIMNAMHLPEFHRNWVEAGLIRAQDLNVNILQDPPYYRIDIATAEYKAQLLDLYTQHIKWLNQVGDPLERATQGFKSAMTFMMATDNTHLIDTFWRKTHELDSIRKESCLSTLPELKVLK
jgi:sulfatase maturation enzyme AslB (radical SAM superfamily)